MTKKVQHIRVIYTANKTLHGKFCMCGNVMNSSGFHFKNFLIKKIN